MPPPLLLWAPISPITVLANDNIASSVKRYGPRHRQVWNLRVIKCKCQGAGLSLLTVSEFLLRQTTPAAAQGGSWVLDFHH